MDELTKRLDVLERKNRWLARTVMLMGIALVGLLAVGWTSPDDTVLLKEDGKIRIALETHAAAGPGITLYDVDEKPRVVLHLVSGEPSISFLDSNRESRVFIGIDQDGSPTIQMMDAKGKTVWSPPKK